MIALRNFSSPSSAARLARLVAPLLLSAAVALAAGERASPGPLPVPERLVLSLTPSPATSIAMTWRTTLPVGAASIQVARAHAGSTLAEESRLVPARTEKVAADTSTTVWHHSAIVDSLEPDTLYAYRVGDGATWSEWSQFRTAKGQAAPFRFLFFGDPQNGVKEYCTRTFRAGFAKAPDSGFYLIAGDLVTTTIIDELWGEFFYAIDPLSRMMPGLNTPGNHDYGQFLLRGQKTKMVSPLFRAHFTQPENGPEGLEETTYFVDYQGVRIVSLNGNERVPEQVAWLDQLLQNNPNHWTIVMMHQPVYSTGKERDNPRLREALLPVYDKHAVDLVLQGHDHSYGRTHKLRNGRRVDDAAPGTVYVVSVTGPKFYRINPQHEQLMAKIDTGKQLFQVIEVDRDTLRYESWTVTGERYDTFTLTKAAAR